MSLVTPADEGLKEDDILWNFVENNKFLKYEHSIEKIKPSRFDFPGVTKHSDDDTSFSDFGIGIINDYLHIGLVSDKFINGQFKRNRILLLVCPSFVPPGSYQNYKVHLADIKRITTLVFQVPEDVLRSYSDGNKSLHEIVAAAAIITPVEKWKLLEREVISSFYHLTFDTATSNLHGDLNVWQNYPVDSLSKEWKQMLYICCGPQGLAYLFKRMLKRNWARIARISVSIDAESDGFSHFFTGGIMKLVIEWAKLFFKPDGVVKFLEEINFIKPALSTSKLIDKANVSFEQYMSSSKKHRCTVCPYQTNKTTHLADHMRTHTGETPFVCDVCLSAHSQKILLEHHKIRDHTGVYPYHCKYCGRPFINLAKMKFHVSVHERKGNVNFECYKCSHIAKDETILMQHMLKHSGDPTFSCKVCNKNFDRETTLLAHSRNHSKDKPFNCHICGKGFLLEFNLRAHYITHSDSRPVFPCPLCKKNLSSIGSLRTHIVAQHGDESKT